MVANVIIFNQIAWLTSEGISINICNAALVESEGKCKITKNDLWGVKIQIRQANICF